MSSVYLNSRDYSSGRVIILCQYICDEYQRKHFLLHNSQIDELCIDNRV